MAQSYFIWNGTDSRTMGITTRGHAPVIRPEERVQHVEIPGRSGDLTETEGENIYNSYIQTVSFSVAGAENVPAVYAWLRGAGYVTFSGEPTKKQKARIIGAITLNRISRNMDRWAGEVQFYCEPLKEESEEQDIDVTTSGTTITNQGDVESRPLITITGSGNVTVRIGDKSISITGCETGWQIDSDTEWILDDDGVPQMGVYTGEFPTIPVGTSAVQFTGSITKLTVRGRWRYL